MRLKSSAFENYGNIPSEYTCDGYSLSPPLDIFDVPIKTKSLVLIMDDPDAVGGTYTHWLVWNIDPTTETIKKNNTPEGGVEGMNSSGKNKYVGPCPPAGTHVYLFKLYALDIRLPDDPGLTKLDIKKLIRGHIMEKTTLKGYYERI